MRVMVVGATGLIGNALLRVWAGRGACVAAATYHCHPGTEFRQLDMRDEAAVRTLLSETDPEVVAVPAANPHVDYCELHPEETRRINVAGTLNVARACRERGARMIFFSSDYVFDGRKELYTESDAPSPINEYGRQKAETEAGVLASDPRNLVIRTSGAYGWQWEPKNFVLQLLAKLGSGQSLPVAADLRYNPTAAENLAAVLVELAAAQARGIYHVVGAEAIARYDFAVKTAQAFGLAASLLRPVSSAELQSPTPRPKSSALATGKVRAAVKTPLWGVEEGLRQMRETEAAWRVYAKRLPKTEKGSY